MNKTLKFIIILAILIAGINYSTMVKAENFFDIREYIFAEDDANYMIYREKYQPYNQAEFGFTTYLKKHWLDYSVAKCNVLPLDFKNCIPAICRLKLPYTTFFRQIKGFEDNKCVYYERFLHYGSTTCKFDLEANKNVITILERNQANARNLSPYEAELIERFYKENCTVQSEPIKVIALQNTFNTTDYDLLWDSNQYSSDLLDIEALANSINSEFIWDQDTVVFNAQQFSQLSPSIKMHSAENCLSNCETIFTQALSTIKKLQLNTIIIINKNQWVLWLNGVKFTHRSKESSMTILHVTAQQATIEWIVPSITELSQHWEQYFIKQNNNTYIHKDNNGIKIKVLNDNKCEIIFNIHLGEYLRLRDFKFVQDK